MAWTSLGTVQGTGNSFGATTAQMNTTSANLLVAHVCAVTDTGANFSDSAGNNWTNLNLAVAGIPKSRLHYVINPITSTNHDFTFDGTNLIFCSIIVQAFKADGLITFDADTRAALTASTIQPGSITPVKNGSLLVCGVGWEGAGTHTIDSGFNETNEIPWVTNVNEGSGLAWLEQAIAAAINPTWTSTLSRQHTANMVSFKEGGGETHPYIFVNIGNRVYQSTPERKNGHFTGFSNTILPMTTHSDQFKRDDRYVI